MYGHAPFEGEMVSMLRHQLTRSASNHSIVSSHYRPHGFPIRSPTRLPDSAFESVNTPRYRHIRHVLFPALSGLVGTNIASAAGALLKPAVRIIIGHLTDQCH